MKFRIVLNGGMSLEADAENVGELLKQLQGREWVIAGEQAIHVPQIQAVIKVEEPIGEIK